MASSSAFSAVPASFEVQVTRDEFYAFHYIDRTLFARLVFGLNRDAGQTSQAIAFLFLLEQLGYVRNLVAYLVSLQDEFINLVANEIAVCVKILHNQDYSRFFAANNNDEAVIPLLLRLTGGRLTLSFVNQNREAFLVGVSKNLDEICVRAFEDLCVRAERYNKEKLLALEREKAIEEMKKMRLSIQQQTPGTLNVQQGIPTRLSMQQHTPIIRFGSHQVTSSVQQGSPSVQQGTLNVQLGTPVVPIVQQGIPTIRLGTLSVPLGIPTGQRERAPSPPLPVDEVTNKSATETNEAVNEEAVVPPDDRTVFLTFSKGYPISESEVRVYFTRKFGEMIEAVLMQEVDENDQPLFARMVLKSECASKMEEIVTARNRNKYTIDGKHVCARKYIPKNSLSSASSSSYA